MMQKVSLITEDGIQIAGIFKAGSHPSGSVLLLHMMPATKESWIPFMDVLAARGFSSLAIDFRGHGESGGVREDHKKKILDAQAGASHLSNLKAVVGASIGANVALQYVAALPGVPAVVALSPGLNYHGVLAMPAIEGLQRTQRAFLAASNDDPESDAAVEKLAERCLAKVMVKHFVGAGHGTTMFERAFGFMDELVDWIAES